MNATPPRRRWYQFSIGTMLVALTAFALIGSRVYRPRRITDDHIRRVQTGVPKERILEILGEPTSKSQSGRFELWRYDDGFLDQNFRVYVKINSSGMVAEAGIVDPSKGN